MKKNWRIIILLIPILSKFLIHLFACCNLGLHRDELLYLALGKKLAWGYWSNPPFIGFISSLGQQIFGDSIFATRLIPMLAGVALVVLIMLMTKELGGKLYAQFLAGMTACLAPAFLRTSNMLMPVIFDFFFWALLLWIILKYVNTQKDKYLYFFGLALGITFLNKILVIFLIPAILIGIVFSPYRDIFRKKAFYLAIAICIIVTMPHLIWQYNYNFPTITHMRILAENQLVNVEISSFLSDQLLMIAAGSLVWLTGLLGLLFYPPLKPYRFYAFTYLTLLIVFMFFKAKSYYTVGYYSILVAAGAFALEIILRSKWLKLAFLILVIGLNIPLMPLSIPLLNPEKTVKYFDIAENNFGIVGARRWENGREYPLPQDYADMLGWEQLADHVNSAYKKLEEPSKAIIYAENYGQAGAIDHYGQKYGLPGCYSFADTYRMWLPPEIPRNINSLIYINDELGEDVQNLFENIEKIGSIDHPLARERGTAVYLCKYPKAKFWEFLDARIKQIRNIYFD